MGKKIYKTPKGVDEREVPYPAKYTDAQVKRMKQLGIKFVNWNGFRFMVGGSQYTLEFFNELQTRMNQNKSNIIIFTGPPGEGKTYCGLRMGEIFDKKFDVNVNVAFDREDILRLFGKDSPLKRRQSVLIDESHFAAGARSWYEDIQKDLVNSMAAIRSKGLMIFIIALHLDMLDKIIRRHVLSYMVYMEGRGLGIAYRLFTPRFEKEMHKNRLGQLRLMLPGYEQCTHRDCLECQYLSKCMISRAQYERRKEAFVNSKIALSMQKQKDKESRKLPPLKETLGIIYGDKEKLVYTNRGTIEFSSILDILEDHGYSVGRSKAIELGRRLMRKYKEELSPPSSSKGAI